MFFFLFSWLTYTWFLHKFHGRIRQEFYEAKCLNEEINWTICMNRCSDRVRNSRLCRHFQKSFHKLPRRLNGNSRLYHDLRGMEGLDATEGYIHTYVLYYMYVNFYVLLYTLMYMSYIYWCLNLFWKNYEMMSRLRILPFIIKMFRI